MGHVNQGQAISTYGYTGKVLEEMKSTFDAQFHFAQSDKVAVTNFRYTKDVVECMTKFCKGG